MTAPRGATDRPWPVAVRRARPEDRTAVLAFATRTWDGWDYIPEVWDRWLGATDGVLLVATAGAAGGTAATDADGAQLPAGHPVAVARLVMLSTDETWLEGIRVDPRVRGMGVATDLQVAELHWAAAHGARVLRYATGQDNEGSHRLGARHGISLLGSWRWYGVDDEDEEIPAPSEAPPSTRPPAPLREADAESWWARVAEDATLRRAQGLYERRAWAFQELTRDRFLGHVARGQVRVWPPDLPTTGARAGRHANPWALSIDRDEGWGDEDPTLPSSPALLIGDGRSALQLLRAVSGGRAGVPRARLPVSDPPVLDAATMAAWTAAGWRPRDGALHILGRPMGAAHPLPAVDDARLLLEDEPRPVARAWSPDAGGARLR